MAKTHADNTVELAGRKFVIEEIAIAKIKELGNVLEKLNIDVTSIKTKDDLVAIVDKALEFPHAFLSIFIKKLPIEIFQDTEDGVKFRELFEAFNKVLEVNRLDALKNVYTRFLQQGR